jgi:TPR repeat protein
VLRQALTPAINQLATISDKFAPAMDAIRAKAEGGDAASQRALGDFYSLRGFAGSAPDGRQAMMWWQKAADQGDVLAMNKLAGGYAVGKLVPRDPAQAVSRARKAADKDDPGAEIMLGSDYAIGFGVSKDKDQALVWLRKAEAHGGMIRADAERVIADPDRQGKPPTPAPADFDDLRNRAAAGDADAQTRLGLIYADDTSAVKDYQKAASWFGKAAKQGNAQAMSELSELYFFGLGVPKDVTQSAYWRQEAARHGRVEDEIALSDAYFVGIFGVPRDMAQSVFWLTKAAEQGSAQAQQKLALVYQLGQRVPRDDAKVLYWLQKSADQHYCAAEQMMAQRYEFGVAGARDEKQARARYVKAADHPDTDFCQNMSEESLKALDRRLGNSH